MTTPDDPGLMLVPAALARRILDLLTITGLMLPALRARAQRSDPAMAAGFDELAAQLNGGQDTAALAARLEAAQRDLADLMLSQQVP